MQNESYIYAGVKASELAKLYPRIENRIDSI